MPKAAAAARTSAEETLRPSVLGGADRRTHQRPSAAHGPSGGTDGSLPYSRFQSAATFAQLAKSDLAEGALGGIEPSKITVWFVVCVLSSTWLPCFQVEQAMMRERAIARHRAALA